MWGDDVPFIGTLDYIQTELENTGTSVSECTFYELDDEVEVVQIKELKVTLKKVG